MGFLHSLEHYFLNSFYKSEISAYLIEKTVLTFLHLKPIYRFEYCSWTHNDRICEFIHQGRAFKTKDKSCIGSRTKLNFVGKALKI